MHKLYKSKSSKTKLTDLHYISNDDRRPLRGRAPFYLLLKLSLNISPDDLNKALTKYFTR